MGWNDHINDTRLEMELTKCKKCRRTYACTQEDQIPGFREKDYDCCPHCGNINDTSMQVEFYCRKLTIMEIHYLNGKGFNISEGDAE